MSEEPISTLRGTPRLISWFSSYSSTFFSPHTHYHHFSSINTAANFTKRQINIRLFFIKRETFSVVLPFRIYRPPVQCLQHDVKLTSPKSFSAVELILLDLGMKRTLASYHFNRICLTALHHLSNQ